MTTALSPRPIVFFTQSPIQDIIRYDPLHGTFYNMVGKYFHKKKFRVTLKGVGITDKSYHLSEIAFVIMTSTLPENKDGFKGSYKDVMYLDENSTNFVWSNLQDGSLPAIEPGIFYSSRMDMYRTTVLQDGKYKTLFGRTIEQTQQDIKTYGPACF